MQLNEYTAQKKRAVFEDLLAGREPAEGAFDAKVLAEARVKGKPQMGTTVYHPDAIELQFIYSDPKSSATVLRVTVPSPERIVFLPVPGWVIESIWQGEISGSYHFERDAEELVKAFGELLEPDANRALFGPKPPTRRE